MDVISIHSFVIILILLLVDYSLHIHGYEFQCLTCDNLSDGPGCGEFTREIPLQTCRTFCYFAILHNRSMNRSPLPSSDRFLRAIRDCSPYDDISIEGYQLIQSKVGSSISPSSIDILTLKRCNSEQCNNEFYLNPEALLVNRSSSSSAPPSFFSFVIIFYFLKNMF